MFSRVLPVLNLRCLIFMDYNYVRYNIADSIARATRHYNVSIYSPYVYDYNTQGSSQTLLDI